MYLRNALCIIQSETLYLEERAFSTSRRRFSRNETRNHRFIRFNQDLFQNDKSLVASKLKECADDNFKFHLNYGKFSKGVENTMGKEEIALTINFFFFPQRFRKTCTADT